MVHFEITINLILPVETIILYIVLLILAYEEERVRIFINLTEKQQIKIRERKSVNSTHVRETI